MGSPGPAQTQVREGVLVAEAPERIAEAVYGRIEELVDRVLYGVKGVRRELQRVLEYGLPDEAKERLEKLWYGTADVAYAVSTIKVGVVRGVLEALLNAEVCYPECSGGCGYRFDVVRGRVEVRRCGE